MKNLDGFGYESHIIRNDRKGEMLVSKKYLEFYDYDSYSRRVDKPKNGTITESDLKFAFSEKELIKQKKKQTSFFH